jgi:hypothetical protein
VHFDDHPLVGLELNGFAGRLDPQTEHVPDARHGQVAIGQLLDVLHLIDALPELGQVLQVCDVREDLAFSYSLGRIFQLAR